MCSLVVLISNTRRVTLGGMSTQTEDQSGPEHPIDRAASSLGGRKELALRLGVKVSAIGNWKDRGVPLEHCASIERVCGGVVTRRDLRPKDWMLIWPELVTSTQGASQEVQHAA